MKQTLYLLLKGISLLVAITDSHHEDTTTSRSSNVKITNNARLFGYVICTQRTVSILACAHTCLLVTRCASFNFRGGSGESGICEHNSNWYLYNNIQPRHHVGWTYGFLVGKDWQTPHALNFSFTSLGGFGASGPTSISGYQGTTLEGLVQLHNGIQIWTVPTRGTYTIEALGASGGNGTNDTTSWRLGGIGAKMKGDFYFMEGTILKILVGQSGLCASIGSRRPGGGGGGSYVTLQDNTPLLIAGGGGGGAAPWIGFHHGEDGQTTGNGSTYGGTGGSGGYIYDIYHRSYTGRFQAGAGGGLDTNGASGNFTPGGYAFKNGGQGGVGREGAQGGFGGGGAAGLYPGGGGGYSGGGVVRATRYSIAGGGGSYNAGTKVENSTAEHRGPGKVEIRLIKPDIIPVDQYH